MKKRIIGLGAMGFISAPTLILVSCGAKDKKFETMGVQGGYSSQMNNIHTGKYDFGGAWADARKLAAVKPNTLVAIGVESNRISNDGIQVRPDMKPHDMYMFQELFSKLIEKSKTDANLKIDDKSIFTIYNHGSYSKITDSKKEVGYLEHDKIVAKKMINKFPAKSPSGGDLFEKVGNTNDFKKFKTKTKITIEFIPSNNPEKVGRATKKLETFLNKETIGGENFEITVASGYSAAANAIQDSTKDVAFLPVNTWAKSAPNSHFILQAGRSLQVAVLDFDENTNKATKPYSKLKNTRYNVWALNEFSDLYMKDIKGEALNTKPPLGNLRKFYDIYNNDSHKLNKYARAAKSLADKPNIDLVAGSYESFIFADSTKELTKLILREYDKEDYSEKWKLKSNLLKNTKYAYTSTTSSASYVYPEMWFYSHFGTTFN